MHAEGVIARRIKRLRKAELSNVLMDDIGAAHLYISIPDRETEARLTREAQSMGFQLPSSPPQLLERSWLDDDFVPLGIEVDIPDASDVDRSDIDSEDSEDFIHI